MKRLSGWDALMLYSETPNVHQHTVKIAVIDTSGFAGEPTFEVFCDTLRQRMHLLEPLRYQLVDIPLHLHRPMWRENVAVDLDYHVRRLKVAAPGGRRELDQVIGDIASTPLDRSRPLWEMYFAEGLSGHRVAVIAKVHHALADGIASANLMARAMEWPDSVQDQRAADVPDAAPTKMALLRAAGADHARLLPKLPALIKDTASGIMRLRRRARERQAEREATPDLKPPPSFINHRLSPRRTFASATLPLDEVKETSKRLEVTVNDVVLATVAGGLRKLLLRYDGRADRPMVASVPTATDTSPERITGNALSTMLVSLPVHVVDPLQRVRLTSVASRQAKENHQLLGPRTIGRWLEFTPPPATIATFRWMSRRRAPNQLLNLVASNVPGPRQRGSIGGAVVSEIYSVGPPAAGAALNITVWSYVDQLSISVLSDDATLDDTHEVTDAMIDAFGEVRRAAGLSQEPGDVESAMT